MKRLVSGIRPTGYLHLGHLEGVLKNCVKLQEEYECFPFIADWHSLTDHLDTENLQEYTIQAAVDWLSAGIDPERSTLFVQSHVKEHAELMLLLAMVTPVPWVERTPSYRDMLQKLEGTRQSPSLGFLAYPVLQAADIIIYKAEVVPVGEDQLPHLELAREIVRRFHHVFEGKVFPEPEALLTEVPNLPGTDGRKMSKSYGNCIYLNDPPEVIGKKVMQMITDPQKIRRNDPGHPEICTVFAYHRIYNPDQTDDIERDCRSGILGCVGCKRALADALCKALEPFHRKRRYWSEHLDEVRDILDEGAGKARKIASQTLEEVREAIRLF
jgi:tryptophanyl-tRNA synthetase